ncbi:MAG: DNA double-strand break repair nuclease NurA, partial [Pyrinomonadaceae bacterium]
MFYQDHLAKALQEQQHDFVHFCQIWREDARDCARRLQDALASGVVADINNAALASGERKGPGALLSAEFENLVSALVPFKERWRSHEESRRWAIEVLRDRTTFAADGSQFLPGRDVSLPTAAVQIAFFENPHASAGVYRKEARLFVVTPRELLEGYGDAHWTAESVVGFRRFEEETRALAEFIEMQRGWGARGEKAPIGFFDGTLLISYSGSRNPLQTKYIEAVVKLVRLSREAQVPVVGFIDQSYARDIVNFVCSLSTSVGGSSIYDAQMLRAKGEGSDPLINSWGDRTAFFLCAREGLKDAFSDEHGEPLVGFIYLQ